MSNNNATNGKDLPNGESPEPKEVVKGPITPELVISDILKSGEETKKPEPESPPSPTPEGEEKPPEGGTEAKDEKPTGPAPADDKKPDESGDEKPFAKIGSRVFKTQDELLKFTMKIDEESRSQKGLNAWLIGGMKKMRPDLFNDDGSIKSAELQKIVEGAGAQAEAAATTLKELGGVAQEELTPEQKADMEKARDILRPLGVVFADDPAIKKMSDRLKQYEEREVEEAGKIIDEFESKHPLFADHRVRVAELMEANGYDLERAWKVCKIENDITEEEPIIKKKDEASGKSVDTTVPMAPRKESGALPASGKRDIWDEVLNIRER